MDFSFATATPLYEANVHPRLFLAPTDIPRLREQSRRGIDRRIMDGLRRKATVVLADIGESVDLSATLADYTRDVWGPGMRIASGIRELALVGLIDENDHMLAMARQLLAAIPAADDSTGTKMSISHVGIGLGERLAGAYDLLYPHMTDAERHQFCQWAVSNVTSRAREWQRQPARYLGAGGNVNLFTVCPVLSMIAAIIGEPEVPDLHPQLDSHLRYFEACINAAIGPDGYPEEDVGYGTVMGALIAVTAGVMGRAGFFDIDRACPHFMNFGNAILHFVQPWGQHLSGTGDHGECFLDREFVLSQLSISTDNPALTWLLCTLDGNQQQMKTGYTCPEFHDEVRLGPGRQVPASVWSLIASSTLNVARRPTSKQVPTAFCDRRRGIVSFRSSWRDDATFLTVDGSQRSPAAQGHAHASCGHISLSAFGELFSVDTNRYNNEQNCHSVVLINGRSGRDTAGQWRDSIKHAGMLTRYLPNPFVDSAAVDSSLQHNCYWARRTVGLVKGRGAPAYAWTAEDINCNDDWNEYWWQLQTAPDNRIRTFRRHATITGGRFGNKMDVHFILPGPDDFPRPHLITDVIHDEMTSSSYNYVKHPYYEAKKFNSPTDQLHFMSAYVWPRLVVKVAGYNGRFMSLMLPRLKGTSPATVSRRSTLPGALAVRVRFADVDDTIIVSYDHRLLIADDIDGRGKWCVVRRRRTDGRVIDHAIDDGTRLSVAGKSLMST